jgi:hypothetical protein
MYCCSTRGVCSHEQEVCNRLLARLGETDRESLFNALGVLRELSRDRAGDLSQKHGPDAPAVVAYKQAARVLDVLRELVPAW